MNAKKISLSLAFLSLVALTGCMSAPAGLDLSSVRHTAKATYIVETRPAAGYAPLFKMHAWEVRVTSAAGQPLDGLKISVDGGMPQHGHGLPTQPKVTRQLGDGRYLVEGMKFSMPGWWEIKYKIDGAAGEDNVTFNTIVNGRPAQPAAPQLAVR
ncbi:FixH family protein [Massilia horti]|uniref:Auxin-binding protein n=1 Tax=Massilia horti TaxID=2562153 RepID=A0A4Y9T2B2_9BURK|nr:FixH family protein [Massilia horti]TFW33198.1 Auxin-binding protein [Massilia horti]